jgi:hypothetical protein
MGRGCEVTEGIVTLALIAWWVQCAIHANAVCVCVFPFLSFPFLSFPILFVVTHLHAHRARVVVPCIGHPVGAACGLCGW